jgi:hypothetical protein
VSGSSVFSLLRKTNGHTIEGPSWDPLDVCAPGTSESGEEYIAPSPGKRSVSCELSEPPRFFNGLGGYVRRQFVSLAKNPLPCGRGSDRGFAFAFEQHYSGCRETDSLTVVALLRIGFTRGEQEWGLPGAWISAKFVGRKP